MTNQALQTVRAEIDALDNEILSLLKQRVYYCLEAVSLKKQGSVSQSVYDGRREQAILDRLTTVDHGDLSAEMIRDIYGTIISACRNLQIHRYELLPGNIVVSVMGIEGSYSEIAAKRFLAQHAIEQHELLYAVSSQQVVEDLMSGGAHYGVVGISNSTAGVVQETLLALQGRACKIYSVLTLPVKHQLMRLTGVDPIAAIYSHEQALRQCEGYLSAHFPGVRLLAYEDTALAAKHLSTGILARDSAVIANGVCAELYKLKVIADNIIDSPDNATTFLVIKKL